MTITPDQARELLDGATHGPWDASFDDEADATRLYPWGEDEEIEDGDSWELARNAPDLAQTIAGMEWQTGVITVGEIIWAENAAEEVMARRASKLPDSRLVRRLVGPVEVIDGE